MTKNEAIQTFRDSPEFIKALEAVLDASIQTVGDRLLTCDICEVENYRQRYEGAKDLKLQALSSLRRKL